MEGFSISPFLIPIAGMGMVVAIVAIVSYFRYKTRQLAAKSGGDKKELEKLRDERKQLEARVQNLESIVCSFRRCRSSCRRTR